MFFDLCFPLIDSNNKDVLKNRVLDIGYHGIAINSDFDSPAAVKPLQASESTTSLLAYGQASSTILRKSRLPFIFRRVTVTVSDSAAVMRLNNQNSPTGSFDIIAVRPQDEKTFQLSCKEANVDIISLDLTNRLPFQMKFPTVNAAIQRGIYFEICYSPCLKDPSQRRNVISNALSLLRVTRGKNIIISSGAEHLSELRNAHDIMNLASLWGTNQQKALASLRDGHAVLMHAFSRKHTVKTAISAVNAVAKQKRPRPEHDKSNNDVDTKKPKLE